MACPWAVTSVIWMADKPGSWLTPRLASVKPSVTPDATADAAPIGVAMKVPGCWPWPPAWKVQLAGCADTGWMRPGLLVSPAGSVPVGTVMVIEVQVTGACGVVGGDGERLAGGIRPYWCAARWCEGVRE